MSDAQLAARAACGDRRALSGIFERHHQAIYRYCRSLLGNDTEAQDALQNTMVRVVRALPGEQREIALKPWLFRIAHNESMRILGARRSHEALEDAPELAAPDQTAGADARERLAALTADLQELPERARSAIVLRELNGASFQEIGTTFGISAAAAKQAVYEARTALQDFEAGRSMECEDVTRAISDGDGRSLRQRKLRAHLRACDDCRAFRAALERRGGDFRALAPPLAPVVAAGVLADVLDSSGGGTAVGSGATTGVGAAAGGTGKATASAAGATAAKMTTAAVGAKVLAMTAVTIAAGAGVLHASEKTDSRRSPAQTRTSGQPAAGAASLPFSHASRIAQATGEIEKRLDTGEASRRQRAASMPTARAPVSGRSGVESRSADGRRPLVPDPVRAPVEGRRPVVPTPVRTPVEGRRPAVPTPDRMPVDGRVPPPAPAPARPTPPTVTAPPPAPAPARPTPPTVTASPAPEVPLDPPEPVAVPRAAAPEPTTAPEVPADGHAPARSEKFSG